MRGHYLKGGDTMFKRFTSLVKRAARKAVEFFFGPTVELEVPVFEKPQHTVHCLNDVAETIREIKRVEEWVERYEKEQQRLSEESIRAWRENNKQLDAYFAKQNRARRKASLKVVS